MATTLPAWNMKDLSNLTDEEREADRIELNKPVSPERTLRRLAALEGIRALHELILAETGGRGVSEEDIQDALDHKDDH
jgi:hypothetical protein